jgi:hypothetical protein
MLNKTVTRRILPGVTFCCLLAAAFTAGVTIGKNRYTMPGSVLHVVTLNWKADATPEQRQQALDGIKAMAGEIPGIKNIWLKKLRSQKDPGVAWDQIFAIEFVNEAAAKAYAEHPKHTEWTNGVYSAARQESRSHQITNDVPMKK